MKNILIILSIIIIYNLSLISVISAQPSPVLDISQPVQEEVTQIIKYPIRFTIFTSAILSGDIKLAIYNTVDSLNDRYYIPRYDYGMFNFMFLHVGLFVIFYILTVLALRSFDTLKNLSNAFKFLIYFIITPFIIILLTMFAPSL